jgi:DNA-binding HxlR family transcriptional regulator
MLTLSPKIDQRQVSQMAKIQSPGALALQSRDAIELLSSKWRVTILHLLTSRRLRANEIQRAIREVSPKVLTQTLRGLERDGLILREVRNVLPAHVEYGLTQMGEGVIPLLRNLCHWAQQNAKNRDDARRRFDQTQKKDGGHSEKS